MSTGAARLGSKLTRRAVVIGSAAIALVPVPAHATLVRGLRVADLVVTSDCIVRLMPLAADSHWEVIGGRRMIVTDTRVRVDEGIVGQTSQELMIRILGGRLGEVGQIVHGQPDLRLHEASVAFLRENSGLHWTVGMAQGHYPLARREDGATVLRASRSLPSIRHFEGSAVQALNGRELTEVTRLLRGMGSR